MPERRMTEIVRERNRFGEVFIKRKRARDRATDRRDLDRMRQPRPQMIARPVEEDLRLVFQPAKRARMDDSRAIALKLGAKWMLRFPIIPTARFTRFLREPRELRPPDHFPLLTRFHS